MNFGLKKVDIVMSDEFVKKVKDAQQKEFDHYRSRMDTKDKALKYFSISHYPYCHLFYASDDLKDDNDIVYRATAKNVGEFQHASKRLKADKDFVLLLLRMFNRLPDQDRILCEIDRVLRSKIKKYSFGTKLSISEALEIVIETEKLNECMPVTSKAVTTGAKRL